MQAVVIGNFDGVHCGHRHLFETARRVAPDARLVAVTFELVPPGGPEAERRLFEFSLRLTLRSAEDLAPAAAAPPAPGR